ncbi:hypothetical protein PNP85_04145, partial [Halobacterium salinarum]|uniref:hypothetical protein n=1 Tax=Halobacterium salinarum TaxID=2242 RepID=UPI002552D85C
VITGIIRTTCCIRPIRRIPASGASYPRNSAPRDIIYRISLYEISGLMFTDSAFGFLQTNNSTTLIGDVELISTSGGATTSEE